MVTLLRRAFLHTYCRKAKSTFQIKYPAAAAAPPPRTPPKSWTVEEESGDSSISATKADDGDDGAAVFAAEDQRTERSEAAWKAIKSRGDTLSNFGVSIETRTGRQQAQKAAARFSKSPGRSVKSTKSMSGSGGVQATSTLSSALSDLTQDMSRKGRRTQHRSRRSFQQFGDFSEPVLGESTEFLQLQRWLEAGEKMDLKRYLTWFIDRKHVADEVNKAGYSPLHLGVMHQVPLPVLQSLLGASPKSVSKRTLKSDTPLHSAMVVGAEKDLVDLLIDVRQEQLWQADYTGHLPLHSGLARPLAMHHTPAVLSVLEAYPAAAESIDQDGFSALHLALAYTVCFDHLLFHEGWGVLF